MKCSSAVPLAVWALMRKPWAEKWAWFCPHRCCNMWFIQLIVFSNGLTAVLLCSQCTRADTPEHKSGWEQVLFLPCSSSLCRPLLVLFPNTIHEHISEKDDSTIEIRVTLKNKKSSLSLKYIVPFQETVLFKQLQYYQQFSTVRNIQFQMGTCCDKLLILQKLKVFR